jgi:hypothetical protein
MTTSTIPSPAAGHTESINGFTVRFLREQVRHITTTGT